MSSDLPSDLWGKLISKQSHFMILIKPFYGSFYQDLGIDDLKVKSKQKL